MLAYDPDGLEAGIFHQKFGSSEYSISLAVERTFIDPLGRAIFPVQ